MEKLAEIITTQDVEKILETIHAMVAIVEKDGRLVSWNSAFELYKQRFPTTDNIIALLPEKDKPVLRHQLADGARAAWVTELPNERAGGISLCDCVVFPAPNGRVFFIAEQIDSGAALQEDIERLSRRVKLYQIESEFTKKLARNKQVELDAVVTQAREVAQTDPLTFLFNRRAIIREFQNEVTRAERYGSMLSISIIDVDHFKSINDTYGHPVGDEVLRQVAYLLREGIRHPDIVGRYGGEEFIIILPSSTSKAAAEQASRLCRRMGETAIHVRKYDIHVTLSIGVAQLRIGEDTWDSLLNRADNAMYEAKKQGRGRWVVAE